MSMFKKKKKKEPKILREVREMSDEEFLEYYKKYYKQSGLRIGVGLVMVLGGIILIFVLF